jgi:hypothetical protein
VNKDMSILDAMCVVSRIMRLETSFVGVCVRYVGLTIIHLTTTKRTSVELWSRDMCCTSREPKLLFHRRASGEQNLYGES